MLKVFYKTRLIPGTILITSILFLTGCQPQYQKQAVFVDPVSLSGQACIKRCSQDKDYCEQRSSEALSGCQQAAQHRAVVELESYQTQYGAPEKTLSDFYDDSVCKQALSCTSVYNQCFVQCGGNVDYQQACIKNCPKVQ